MIAREFPVVRLAAASLIVIGGTEVAAEPTGVVTVSSNAKVIRNGQTEDVDPLFFQLTDRTIVAGDAVSTGQGGSAAVRFADYGTVVNLCPESKLLVENLPPRAKHVALGLRLEQGSAVLTRKAFGPGLVAIVGDSGHVQGHVLLAEGSVVISVQDTKVVVEALQGSARFINGPLLDAPLAQGDGRLLSTGEQVTAGADEAPMPVAPGRAENVWRQIHERTYAFGIQRSTQWIERAERGDFTPVRSGESRAEPELVGTDFV
ncbi:MAG: hypothetical protein IH987_03020, partial [Planctomycetes bacterium]|nr:hypothetical protein [Planctomycetota bacterium]